MIQEKLFQPKLLTTLQTYSWTQFSRDLFAGIIVAVIAIPLSIAFGIASGVTPAQGLLTAVVGGFFISLLGGSRVQIGGPTGAFIVIVYGIVLKFGVAGLIIATFMAGVLLLVFGFMRLGSTVKYIPQPIIIGFTSGIAVTILVSQLKDLFGFTIDKMPGDFIGKIIALTTHLGTFNPWAFGLGAATFLLVALGGRLFPRLPVAFVVLAAVTIFSQALQVPVTTIGSLYGKVSLAVTPLNFSGVTYQTFVELLPAAFSIAFLGAVESLLSAAVADAMIGGRYRPNTELIGQGIANLASSLVGGIPATGAIARTAANVRNGGRTPVSGIVCALSLLVIMIFLSPTAALVPMAALAGLLVHVAYKMGAWKEFRRVARTTKADAVAIFVTFTVTVMIDLVYAIISGLVVTAFLFIHKVAQNANVEVESQNEKEKSLCNANIPPGVQIIDLNGAFFFGAATKFEEVIRTLIPRSQTLIIRMEDVSILDATGTSVLQRLLQEAKAKRVRVIFSEVKPQILQVLEHAELIPDIGSSNIFANLEGALKEVRASQPLVLSTVSESNSLDPV